MVKWKKRKKVDFSRIIIASLISIAILTVISFIVFYFINIGNDGFPDFSSCNNGNALHIKPEFTCYNGSGIALVGLERGNDEYSLSSVELLFYENGKTKIFEINETAINGMMRLVSSTDFNTPLELPQKNQFRVYVVNTGMNPGELAIIEEDNKGIKKCGIPRNELRAC